MSGNSRNMTIEDKVVQYMKNNTLSELIGDEDAISKLAERAINEALFQPIRVRDENTYAGWKDGDSTVVAAARELAKKLSDELIKKIADNLFKDEKFLEMITKAFAVSVSLAIRESAKQSVDKALDNIALKAHSDLISVIQVNGLRG